MSILVEKKHTFTGHRDCVYALHAGSEDATFFSGSGDGMVVLWDLKKPDQGELIAKLPNSVYALHRHAESNLLVVGHNYEGIHVIDWQTKKEIGSLKFTAAAIFDIQSYGSALFVGDASGAVHVINLKQLKIEATIKQSDKSARTLAVNEETRELAVGYSDNAIRVFGLDDLQLKYAWEAHKNSVFTVRFSPDGRYLYSGSRDAHLKMWDVRGGYAPVGSVVAHMYAINHLDFSPDGKHFVTCSMDKSMKVWDLEELKLLKVIDRARHAGHATSVNKVLWTNHESQLVSASDDRTISVWNIKF